MPYKIFICYRRADKELARGIEGRLVREFGAHSVFLDVESISGGQEWKKSILKALSGKPVVVTLITTKWNSRRRGQLKLMDADDHVRYELETALQRGLHIVPVLYERAHLPKSKQLPPSLQPLLEFQKISIRNESWKDDSERLIADLRILLPEVRKQEPVIDSQTTIRPFAHNAIQTSNLTRPMFRLSPTQRREFEEKKKQENERLARVRSESPSFYALPAFWIAVVITVALSIGSVFGAEILTELIGEKLNIVFPNTTLTAKILLPSVWSIMWLSIGIAAYNYYPARGSKIFYTRGILGGWVLGYEDWEPIGYWAAFPISTAVLWLAARATAMLSFHYLQWNYLLIFWIVLVAYTLPVLVLYGFSASDEVY